MLPALCLRRMRRVEDTFIDKRNRVMIRRSEGNTEKSRGSFVYMVRSKIAIAMLKFTAISTSSRAGGSGMTIMATINSTNTDMMLLVPRVSIRFPPRLVCRKHDIRKRALELRPRTVLQVSFLLCPRPSI